MNKRFSKFVENFILVGTGCLALSGLLFVDYRPNGLSDASTAVVRKADSGGAAKRTRAEELLAKLPDLEGRSIREGRLLSRLGAHVFTAGRSKSRAADDIVIVDYGDIGHREGLSFMDEAGRPLLIQRQSGEIFVLEFTSTGSNTIRTMVDGQPIDIVDLPAVR